MCTRYLRSWLSLAKNIFNDGKTAPTSEIHKVGMAEALRSVERCKVSAIFVAPGLDPPVLVCVPLAGDILLVVAIMLVVAVV